MKKRLFFLAPSLESAERITKDLQQAQISEDDISVIAKQDLTLEDVPEAPVQQRSDLIPALERGVALGGVAGLLAGLAAVAFPPAGLALGGGAVLALGAAGAGIGGLGSTLMGVSVPNSRLDEFQEAIGRGELLMLVDVPDERSEAVQELIRRTHPEAEIASVDADKISLTAS
ncbi:MAG: DUF1269 domain-containing protein [Pseudomonadota bacterium]|nr:DUF1269 domain-containing protein [Pseudomonadota bacterium]